MDSPASTSGMSREIVERRGRGWRWVSHRMSPDLTQVYRNLCRCTEKPILAKSSPATGASSEFHPVAAITRLSRNRKELMKVATSCNVSQVSQTSNAVMFWKEFGKTEMSRAGRTPLLVSWMVILRDAMCWKWGARIGTEVRNQSRWIRACRWSFRT